MGHYDSSYEYDREENLRKRKESAIYEIKQIIATLDTKEAEFLYLVAKNIRDWIGFANAIKSLKK